MEIKRDEQMQVGGMEEREESRAERSASGVATSSAHSAQAQIIRDSLADI